MCNLYSLRKTREPVHDLFGVGHNRSVNYQPLPAIFPGHVAPVVRLAPDGERELVALNWGFLLLRAGYAPKRVTNTRDDKIASGFWRQSFEQRRCLVPATSFCEPHDGRTPATWHWFALKGDEPRPLFAFAGIWQRWRGPVKKDGPNVEQDVYSFMTTMPNELTASINHERSPVLLTTAEERETWLKGTPEQARALVKPIAADRLAIVQEGFEKRDLQGESG
jgi:putative SOS response-associated peptidase YedK